MGFSTLAAERLVQPTTEVDAEQVFCNAWKEAAAALDASQADFTYRDAIQRVCEAAQVHGVSGIWLANRLAEHLNHTHEVRPLGVVAGEQRYATDRMWKLEQKLLAEVEHLRATPAARVNTSTIESVLSKRKTLLDDQREAARHLLGEKSALRVLTGVAGAGKSFTLDVVREVLEKSGYRVMGGAIAGIAKEELAAKAGIESRTVASYLYHLEKPLLDKIKDRVRHDAKQLLRALQGKPTYLPTKVTIDKKTVLVLDEAGMIDTKTMYQLCKAVRKRGGTIILVGDRAQLQPIAAGGPFAHLTGRNETPHLTTNLRQRDADDRKAAEQLRSGEAKPALDSFAKRGRLVVTKDRGQAVRELVTTWSKCGGAKSPQEHVIFTPTRAEAQAANRLAQRERDAARQIDSSRSLRNGDDVICHGDRVLFHKNVYADGVRNGYRGVVTSVDRFRGALTIRLDGQDRREVKIRLRDYGPEGLSLGYAQTSHKGQGQTVQHAYLLVGGRLADREMAYVQATRGRLSTQLFVDQAHAGEDLEDLARALSRSRTKELAHDLAKRARRSLKHGPEHARSH